MRKRIAAARLLNQATHGATYQDFETAAQLRCMPDNKPSVAADYANGLYNWIANGAQNG